MKLFKIFLIVAFALAIGTLIFIFAPSDLFQQPKQEINHLAEENQEETAPPAPTTLIPSAIAEVTPVPEEVKGVYVTSWSASRDSYIDYLIQLAKDDKINSVVIDIKDWSGYVGYNCQVPEVIEYGARSIRIKDAASLVKKLHDNGLYVIARIAVFQDPILAQNRPEIAVQSQSNAISLLSNRFLSAIISYAPVASLWLDQKGLAWIDPAAKEGWDYNIAIAKDALNQGFDEINFDYVRFPSDGDLKSMVFPVWDGKAPKNLAIKEFFKYLREQMPNTRLSVDLFGLSCTSADDLGVGQKIEDAFSYFDYISPMVYPSHYAHGFLGYENPAQYPYEVVNYSIFTASQRLNAVNQTQQTNAKIRPWLQDFNMGAIYDTSMVKAEIQAVKDALLENYNGFMLWNASNYYTEEALSNENQ